MSTPHPGSLDLSPDEWALLAEWRAGRTGTHSGLREPGDQAALDWLRRGRRPRPYPRRRVPRADPSAQTAVGAAERDPYTPSPWQAVRWASVFFEPAESRAWLLAGLKESEWWLAEELRDHRITPAMLSVVIRKQTILERLRDNLSTARVADLLRREGHLTAPEAKRTPKLI